MTEIEKILRRFCAHERSRLWMGAPFSRAGFTWATDGKILVRAPLIESVGEDPRAADVERVWKDAPARGWRSPAMSKLPAVRMDRCGECFGRGYEHDCPDCQCVCQECNGTGRFEMIDFVGVGERAVGLKYARLIVDLPFVEIVEPVLAEEMLHFRFTGGEGLVMLLRSMDREHVAAI